MARSAYSSRRLRTPLGTNRSRQGMAKPMAVEQLEDRLTPAALTPNQNFVAHTYLTLLDRSVDPVGLAAWGGLLDQGASRFQVALDIEGSFEFRTDLVAKMYHALLKRQPDPGGLNAWVQFLGNGGTEDQLALAFLDSPEYFQDHGGTNDGFLDGVYQDLQLGIPTSLGVVDPLARQGWDEVFASGVSRFEVAQLLFAGRQNLTGQVDGRYDDFLHRGADPGGEAFWVNVAQQNGLGIVTAGIIGSDEFYAKAQQSVLILTPILASFTPAIGSAGTSVTISGSGFTGASAVLFNNIPANFTVQSDLQILATAPSGVSTGPITVANAFGSATSGANFSVAATITSFTPAAGSAGSSVTIAGTNFTGATAVTFNGVAAGSFSVNPAGTQITATVPASAASGPIAVTTPAGTATSASSFTVSPALLGFSPASGPAGTAVTINGTDLQAVTGVTFNGAAAAFVLHSPTEISATVPVGATTGPITLLSASGNSTSTGNFTVSVSTLPMISGLNPTSGPVGTSVVITGVNFTGATAVQFNGTSASAVTVNSNTQITATVPSGATTGPVTVVTPNGTALSPTAFTVSAPTAPTVTSFTPSSGPVGTTVTINGTNLTGANQVLFNGTAATTITPISATQISAVVPAGATTGLISVSSPNGTGTSATSFTVTPRITGFTPLSGIVGSTVTINGSNFAGATSVTFNGVSATINSLSATSITATVPATATTGPIAVFTPNGTAVSSANFTVQQPPQIVSFTPGFGAPGDSVIITGSGFTGVTAVAFNGTAAGFTLNSDTQITATVPAGATTGSITVTTPAGTGSSMSMVFGVAPVVSSFTQGSQSPAVGDTITISGQNFTAGTTVTFLGTPSQTVTATFISTTQISVAAPYVGTGQIMVTTSFGSATSTTALTIYVQNLDQSNTTGETNAFETVSFDISEGSNGTRQEFI
jgi:hypothetical protein